MRFREEEERRLNEREKIRRKKRKSPSVESEGFHITGDWQAGEPAESRDVAEQCSSSGLKTAESTEQTRTSSIKMFGSVSPPIISTSSLPLDCLIIMDNINNNIKLGRENET